MLPNVKMKDMQLYEHMLAENSRETFYFAIAAVALKTT